MLRDKKVVVIGGSSGIGLEVARAALAADAEVVLAARSEEKLVAAREHLQKPVAIHAFDGAHEHSVHTFFQDIGQCDHLVIVAGGGGAVGALREIQPQALRAAFERKLWVHITVAHHAIDHIRAGGTLTFVTAITGKRARAGMSGLAAVNGALNAMVAPLALELAPTRVNAVAPGVIDTPYWERIPEQQREQYIRETAAQIPLKRLGTPQEVAQAVLFVLTNEYITGTILEIDGGVQLV